MLCTPVCLFINFYQIFYVNSYDGKVYGRANSNFFAQKEMSRHLIRKVPAPGHFFFGERRKNGYLKLIFTLKMPKKLTVITLTQNNNHNHKKMCSCKDYLKLSLDIVELESEVRANNPSSPSLIPSSN